MSLGLTAAELAEARADYAAAMFTDLCTFMKVADRGIGDRGEAGTGVDVVVAAAIPCRIASTQQSAAESVAGGQVTAKVKVAVFVPHDTARPAEANYLIVTTQGNRRIEVSGSVWVSENLALKIEGWENG
jgi:hypothetical protein